MNYVIDITRERVKRAMLALGIEDDELLLKTEDDFSSKGITPDVRHLRFAFFSRKQQELLRQIKTFMKEEYIRFNEQKSRISDSDHDQSFSGQDMFNELISKTKQKNQEIIQKHLSSVQNNFSEIKAIEARLQNGQKIRENLKSSVTKQRMKMMEFKQKQLENLEKYSKSPIRVKSSNRKHDLSPAKFVRRRDLSPKARFNHDDFLNEEETIKKIQGFEEKMEKSKELSESFIQSKKEAISKLLEKSSKSHQKTSNDLEYNEKLLKIVEKANQADIRRGNLLKIQTERRIKQKEIEEQRRSKTRSKLNENRKDLEKKNKDIEEKMRRSEYVLEKKQEKWMKELEIRNELQRLRDEETLLNAERKKRASKHKREIILEKQLENTFRLQQIKEEKEDELKKKMEIANKNMIEKEKLYETLCSINKLPEKKIFKIKEKSSI